MRTLFCLGDGWLRRCCAGVGLFGCCPGRTGGRDDHGPHPEATEPSETPSHPTGLPMPPRQAPPGSGASRLPSNSLTNCSNRGSSASASSSWVAHAVRDDRGGLPGNWADQHFVAAPGEGTQSVYLARTECGFVADPHGTVFERVDGVFGTYWAVVETAVLPDGVVGSSGRDFSFSVEVAFHVFRSTDLQGFGSVGYAEDRGWAEDDDADDHRGDTDPDDRRDSFWPGGLRGLPFCRVRALGLDFAAHFWPLRCCWCGFGLDGL